MGGDYTRLTFDPREDHAGVFMQQGRVQLDADWNELVELIDRRRRAETLDIIGACVVPRETPDGFRIVAAGGTVTIGRGRIYVDGLLAENHGTGADEFDARLAELRGTQPIPYNQQPYLPNPPALPQDGPHLVYLDVWQREITALEEPDLLEVAVGVDTATRVQTVWQVRVLPNVDAGVTCTTPDGEISGWLNATRPSAGRLSTAAVAVPASTDPCFIPPSGGFRGIDNRLYRVEVHDAGALGAATFKWSRDNGSIAAAVTAIDAGRTDLTVSRTGRDAVLRFGANDWVEVTDDARELAGLPGEMRQVDHVDDVTRTVVLKQALTAGLFPTPGAGNATDPARHTRIRRWDQRGTAVDANGGLIGVPGGAVPTPIVLEDGVQVTFELDPNVTGGQFRTADYWVFAARTVDGSVERLRQAPPRGIHHHYCRLAIVTFPATVTDCRVLWPPETAEAGCDCSVCVSADSHNSGALTIQMALDAVRDRGGKVCLAPGDYHLREPVRIEGARSVRLQGKGWRTRLLFAGEAPALIVENSLGVTVEELALLVASRQEDGREGPPSALLRNCAAVTIQRCILAQAGRAGLSAGDLRLGGGTLLGLAGVLYATFIRENLLMGEDGIRTARPRGEESGAVLTIGLYIEDNALICERRGVSLDGFALLGEDTRLVGNYVYGCEQAGIAALGAVMPRPLFEPQIRLAEVGGAQLPEVGGAHLDVRGNTVRALGDAVVIGVDDARVVDNDIGAPAAGAGRDGIVLTAGLDRKGIDRCQAIGNRIAALARHGISVRTTLLSAMIKQNVIERVGGGGIVMEDGSRAGTLIIENNQLVDIAPEANDAAAGAVAMRLLQVLDLAITANTIAGVARAAMLSPHIAGMLVIGPTTARIAGNEVIEIGPSTFVGQTVGIAVRGGFDSVDVVDNVVRRGRTEPEEVTREPWIALEIVGDFAIPVAIVTATASAASAPVTPTAAAPATPGQVSATVAATAETRPEETRPEETRPVGEFTLPPTMILPGIHAGIIDEQPFILTAVGIFFFPVGRQSVGARGNVLDAYGDGPTVRIEAGGPLVFGENRCRLRPLRSRIRPIPHTVAMIAGGRVVASGNTIDGLIPSIGLDIRTFNEGLATVLGNIATPTSISLNGVALGAPWQQLNL